MKIEGTSNINVRNRHIFKDNFLPNTKTDTYNPKLVTDSVTANRLETIITTVIGGYYEFSNKTNQFY